MTKATRILWCNHCVMMVLAKRLYRQRQTLGKNNIVKHIYICPMCGKMIKERQGV